MIALGNTWVLVSREFLLLNLRQKAILALNGETERLVYYFAHNTEGGPAGIAGGGTTIFTCAISGATLAIEGRVVTPNTYPQEGQVGSCPVNTPDTSDHINSVVGFTKGQVFALGVSGSNVPATHNRDHNLVWLDQKKRVVGSVFWETTNTVAAAATPADCRNGGANPCQELTVYMQYPFRFTATGTATGTLAIDPALSPNIDTIFVKTIVGERF